ncbi:MAG TPA: flagellar hook-associated protein FlgK [Arthrobacter sp.]
MSTFGSINTAYSGLSAARAAMEIAGQNIANANTTGYTRQRVDTSPVAAPANVGLAASTTPVAGQGVSTDSITQLGDKMADNQVRASAAQAGYASVRSDALSAIESNMGEPGTEGISSALHTLWANFSDVANQPNTAAPANVLLQNATVLTGKIAAGYTAMDNQWTVTRGTVDSMAADLNTNATQVAILNGSIRSTMAAGGNANELIDQRSQLVNNIASLAGGTVRDKGDGTIDVVVGGNAIVSGTTTRTVVVSGAARMNGAAASPVSVEWADKPGQPISPDGGKLAGAISVLAAANGGTGGAIAESAESYNRLAQNLASTVNAVHQSGATPSGAAGGEFFHITAGVPAAQGLSVVPKSKDDLATGTAGAGAFDGSNATKLSELGNATGGPGDTWSATVTTTAVAAKSAILHGDLAESVSAAAVKSQASSSGVDLDEENVHILAAQRAYQAAARVMSAIDETLDTLINRTGMVGR